MENKLNQGWREEFDKICHCIQTGCDNNGSIAERGSDGEWDQQQCQYCDQIRFPTIKFISQLQQSTYNQAIRQAMEAVGGNKQLPLPVQCNEEMWKDIAHAFHIKDQGYNQAKSEVRANLEKLIIK
jgi:hypothetical protein